MLILILNPQIIIQMLTNTSLKISTSTPTQILVPILLSLLIALTATQPTTQQSSIECLLSEQITTECIDGFDVEYWIKNKGQYVNFMCPVLVEKVEKIMEMMGMEKEEENGSGSGDRELVGKLVDGSLRICQVATRIDQDNGYLLFFVYMIKGLYIPALELEYQLFFNQPFGHQAKFASALQKSLKYLPQSQIDSLSSEYEKQAELAIKQFYKQNLQASLKHLQPLLKPPPTPTSPQPPIPQPLLSHLIFLHIRILERAGQFPDALSQLNKYLNLTSYKDSNNVHWYLYHMKGNLLMHHLKFKEAIQLFQVAVNFKKEGFFGFSLYNLGLCYQKIGKYQQSIEYFKRILVANPANADVLNSIGFAYYSLIGADKSNKQTKNNARNAQNYLTKAINSNNSYYIPYYNLGILKYDMGQYQQAVQHFENSIRINPNSSNISSKFGLFKSLYKIDRTKAMRYLDQDLAKAEGFVDSDVAAVLYELQEYAEALKYISIAANGKSNLGEVYERKGMIEFQLNLIEQAIDSFKKALQHGNTRSSVWFNLAYLQEQSGNYSKALHLYRKAQESDPSGPAQEMIQKLQQKMKESQDKKKANSGSEL